MMSLLGSSGVAMLQQNQKRSSVCWSAAQSSHSVIVSDRLVLPAPTAGSPPGDPAGVALKFTLKKQRCVALVHAVT